MGDLGALDVERNGNLNIIVQQFYLVEKTASCFLKSCLNYEANYVWYRIKHIYNGFPCDIEKYHSL